LEEEIDGLRVLRAGRITIINANIFDVTLAQLGRIDRIWDRAALVALPDDTRPRYVRALRSFASPGALLLENVLEYDTSKKEGPPFSVSDAEIRALYQGCEIELLEENDDIDQVPQFKHEGHEYFWGRTYLITL
jgi:thiopurine S-methyltransferase